MRTKLQQVKRAGKQQWFLLGLPHLQLELPLFQFVPIAPCPVAGHHWKESGPVLLTPTLQIFRGISKVPSQPSLLQAEQAQLPQPLLVGDVLASRSGMGKSAWRIVWSCCTPQCGVPVSQGLQLFWLFHCFCLYNYSFHRSNLQVRKELVTPVS